MADSLLWLTATLAAYAAGSWLFQRCGRPPWLNPVFTAIALLIAALQASGTPYPRYFAAAQIIHLLLGPATVALALPLWHNLKRVRAILLPLSLALLVGCLAGIGSALLLGKLLGLSGAVLISFGPKSVTTPIAMALAERLGGIPALAAAIVLVTGVLGAMVGDSLLQSCGVRDDISKGVAIGIAAHGVGTARAFQISETCGAFAGLAMGLNGLLTSLLLPVILGLWPIH